MWVPQKPGKGVLDPLSWSYGWLSAPLPHVDAGSQIYPLQGQQVLLIAEPSSETLDLIIFWFLEGQH